MTVSPRLWTFLNRPGYVVETHSTNVSVVKHNNLFFIATKPIIGLGTLRNSCPAMWEAQYSKLVWSHGSSLCMLPWLKQEKENTIEFCTNK